MAESFLRLEIDNKGIKAKIIEQGYNNLTKPSLIKGSLIKDSCRILFKDMPEIKPENSKISDPFDAGMDMVATQLDLASCSKAIIFI